MDARRDGFAAPGLTTARAGVVPELGYQEPASIRRDAISPPIEGCDAAYGKPSAVQEFDEERARNRRFLWRRGDEAPTFICFRFGRQPFSAAELTTAVRGSD
jgi:hypothetical protein